MTKCIPLAIFLTSFVVCLANLGSAAEKKLNVLLFTSDDLAAMLACYGHPLAKTPHLDALAKRGVLFERAYCQFPHCNPSRASMLSGLRPNTTRVTNNEDNLYTNIPGVVTLPHHFESTATPPRAAERSFIWACPRAPRAWTTRRPGISACRSRTSVPIRPGAKAK